MQKCSQRVRQQGHSRRGISLRALVEHGLVGLVLVREINGLVVARREVDVAQHLAAARPFAFDVDREGGALTLPAQDGAEAEHQIDVASRDLHARYPGIRTVALAHLVLRVGADEREVLLAEQRRCERRKRGDGQHSDGNLDYSPSLPSRRSTDACTVENAARTANDQI